MPHTISAGLRAHLDLIDEHEHTLTEWWQIKPRSMGLLAFTSLDEDLTFDAGNGNGVVTHRAATGFVRSAMRSNWDQMLSTMHMQSFISDDAISHADIRAGRFRNADVWFGKVNYEALADGVIPSFRGRVGRIIVRDWGYEFELRSLLDQLVSQVGQTMEGNTTDAIGKFLPGADTVRNPP